MSSNSIIAAAAKHFADVGLLSIEIPEWQVDGKPAKIFWRPLTVDERHALFKRADKNDADVLIMKALKTDGAKLFTLEDKPALLQAVDAEIVTRIATRMLAGISEQEIKN